MPIHAYSCKKCKTEFEAFYTTQSAVAKEEPAEKCPSCGSKSKKRLISKATSFILKGTGWAKDRYGR